ncbi:MAG: acyl-CoA dehydrogenase [Spirochaetes bacterium]|nr:acyl-CoA dehydrogenase [Spirochaetota bacterium]
METQFISERNLKFMLYEVFDAESLLRYPYFSEHSRETIDMMLETAMKIGKERLRPHYEEMDRNPPRYDGKTVKVHPMVRSFMKESGDGGWISIFAPFEQGGQQMPLLAGFLPTFIFNAANYSASVYPGLSTGAAHLISSFGTEELRKAYIPKLYSGEWQGTMALTEPQAGSSLADITTTATPTDDGSYLIRGQKIFISAGDHDCAENVIHLLLGRIQGAPAGLKGLSLFLVPKNRIDGGGKLVANDVTTAGIYHKMGYRGAPITQLAFGDGDDCRGFLVGEPNRGLSYMLQMMNEARLSVGFAATAIASAAYYSALGYADERPQGRPITSKDPQSPQIPIIQHADVKRMLLFQRAVIEGSLSLLMQCTKYADLEIVCTGVEKEKYKLLLDLLTPVAKTYPSETGILSVSQALQCLGGYGYCDDFPVEQYYRDMRIHPIHEGTTGIQSLTLLGRNVTMKNGKAFQLFLAEAETAMEDAETIPELASFAGELRRAVETLKTVTNSLIGLAIKGNIDLFLADATLYMEMFGILAVAWQWLLQATVISKALAKGTAGVDSTFYGGKMYAFRYFFGYELPRIEGLARRLMNADGLTVEMPGELFRD